MMKGCSNCVVNLPPAHAAAAVLVTTPKLSSTSNMSQIHPVFSFNHHHPHHHMTSSTVQAAGRRSYSSNKQQQPSAAVAPARSSRWNPTPEQIMVLEDLYRSGIKTPTAQQIRLVTARLRHYGRIEGKNVFYWFQNHRARERQKKRRELISMCHHHQSGVYTTTKQERQTLTTVNSNAISGLPLGGLLQQADKKSAGSGVDFVGRLEVKQQQNKWTLQNCGTVISDQESSSVLKERLMMRSMGKNSSRNNILVEQSADDTLNYTKGDLDVFHHYCYDHCNDAAAVVLTTAPIPKKEEQVEEDEESKVAHQTLELFPLKSENLKDTQLAATTVIAHTADFQAASDRYFRFLSNQLLREAEITN